MVLLLRERIDDRAGFARPRDVVQVRRTESSLPSEHVTAAALAFAPKDLFTVRGIPGQGVVDCRPSQCADICSDFPDFIVRKLLGAHWCPWNAGLDRIEYLPVGNTEIRAGAGYDGGSDLAVSAIRSMAAGATLSIETLALVNSFRFALEWIYGPWRASLGKNRMDRAGQKQPCH
jgi:hypothetical protein